MHLIYIEDSGDEQLAIFSALAIPVEQWRDCFTRIKEFRRNLKQAYGIYVYKELHAWKFVSGRGQIADRVVTKSQRAATHTHTENLLFAFILTFPSSRIITGLPQNDCPVQPGREHQC
ncbi:MAG TPA: hypothetical protein VL171_05990 [Verrucomicrobiae bacterium]|nr:hypothetical protein [Verrucomicrobiae bacterium]